MPDLDTTINDGDQGHALLHQDTNIEVNSVRGRMLTAENKLTTHDAQIAQKLTPGPNGVTLSQLDPTLQSTIGNRAYTHPYPVKVDARASQGKQAATRPDSPLVIWGLDVGQALPAAFQTGTDPKYPGDTAVYVVT